MISQLTTEVSITLSFNYIKVAFDNKNKLLDLGCSSLKFIIQPIANPPLATKADPNQ
jgi:hypothetical protein